MSPVTAGRLLLVCLAGWLTCPLTAAGVPRYVDPHQDSLILAGVTASLEGDFDRALASFQRLTAEAPEHPVGYFFTAALYNTRIIDLEEYRFEDDFYRFYHLARERIKVRSAAGTADAFDLFIDGMLDGYVSVLQVKKENWFSGVTHGLRAYDRLEEAVAADSLLYDAYWCLGTYRYYRSALASKFSWLPFVSDRRQEGIGLVQRSVERSRYSAAAAKEMLMWLYYDEDRLPEALALARELHEQYPENRIFLWGLGDVLYKMKDWPAAERTFKKLLEKTEGIPYDNHYNAVVIRGKLARMAYKAGRCADAFDHCKKIEAYQLREDVAERLEKKMKEYRKIAQAARACAGRDGQ